MKTVFILALLCAAAVLNGCSSTGAGGTTDPYTISPGNTQINGPTTSDPSLPQGNNADTGPQISPP